MLYDSQRHEVITTKSWSEEAALDAAHAIFDFLLQGLVPGELWSADPRDEAPWPYNKSLYDGAAGIMWTLVEMGRRLERELPFQFEELSQKILDSYLLAPDTKEVVPSFFLGESGVLLTALKFAVSPTEKARHLARLQEIIAANTRNPVNEALWGCPGTMLVALRLGLIDLYKSSADYLFEQWHIENDGQWSWEQDLYGKKRKFLGAAHGFFGNLHALLEGRQHLTESQQDRLLERSAITIEKSAEVEGSLANWLPIFYDRTVRTPIVQWCHGAPGAITSLRSFPKAYSPEVDTLLNKAGELVWTAGPLKKGIGLCHGTDGNGYAFLRLFDRTGEEIWLDRARQFAMHAISQRNGRFGLWTGEAGLGLYLLDVVEARSDWPTLDYF